MFRSRKRVMIWVQLELEYLLVPVASYIIVDAKFLWISTLLVSGFKAHKVGTEIGIWDKGFVEFIPFISNGFLICCWNLLSNSYQNHHHTRIKGKRSDEGTFNLPRCKNYQYKSTWSSPKRITSYELLQERYNNFIFANCDAKEPLLKASKLL